MTTPEMTSARGGAAVRTVPPEATVDEVGTVGLRDIACTFLSIGVASFSLAALGEAKDQVTRKRAWFTEEEYMQGLGLAQLMPGAPTVNLSAYLGYRLRGLPGAVLATVSFLVPCFVLMLLLSYLYFAHGNLPVVSRLFRGLAALVVGLVFSTVLNLWKSGVKTAFQWLMALVGFAFVSWLKMGVVRILLVAGCASLLAVVLSRSYPSLARWTTPSAPKAGGASPARTTASHSDPGAPSACSAAPLRLGWKHTGVLVVWLSLALALDLALISQRPDLMQMGSRFLRIGALVFGSGYAMLPFIQDAVVNASGWLTNEQFAVALALSLVTPGPVTIIGVFSGYKVAGVLGALVGMVNMYFPAWAMTTIVAAPYAQAGKVTYLKQVTQGIVAAFIGTLLVVLIRLGSETLIGLPAFLLAGAAFIAQRTGKIATIWIVVTGALLSLVFFPA